VIKVLVADDQPVVRGGVRMIVEAESDMTVAGEAGDGREAVERARLLRPDVVLMDVRMPGIDGLEATRRLLGTGADGPRVLVLTTFDLDEYVYEALRAGASGFLLKSAPPERIADAIRTVAAGDALLAPQVTRRLIEAFVRHPRPRGGRPPEVEELTERELEVLKLLRVSRLL
jgi:DNA-binding NarL/FixJ family response regulator